MARLKGVLKIQGTLDNLSFFETQDGIIVRRKWGPDRKRMNNDKAFDAVRDHGKEFGAAAKHSQLLRRALWPLLRKTSDNRVTGRVNKILLTLTKMDMVSRRGERSLVNGLKHKDAGTLLNGFEFNINCQLKDHLVKLPVVKKKKDKLYIEDTFAKKDLHYPIGTTHAILSAGWLRIDFEKRKYELIETNTIELQRKTTSNSVLLKTTQVPVGKGIDIFVLKLVFCKKVKKGTEVENELKACAIIT